MQDKNLKCHWHKEGYCTAPLNISDTSSGILIDQPGKYHFVDNVRPRAKFAIVIAASDVVLNLNEYTLSTCKGSVGIYLEDNVNRVTIKNGTIRGFATAGVGSHNYQH